MTCNEKDSSVIVEKTATVNHFESAIHRPSRAERGFARAVTLDLDIKLFK